MGRKIKDGMYLEAYERIALELLFPFIKDKIKKDRVNVIEIRRWYSSSFFPNKVGIINVNAEPIALYTQKGWADDINYDWDTDVYIFTPRSIFAYSLCHIDLPEDDPMFDTSLSLRQPLEEFMEARLSSKGLSGKIEIGTLDNRVTYRYSYSRKPGRVSGERKKYIEELLENLKKMDEQSSIEKIWKGKKMNPFNVYLRKGASVLKRNIKYTEKGKNLLKTFYGSLNFIPDKIKYELYQTVTPVIEF